MANAKDAERCNSGILDMKAFDGLDCYEGTFTLNESRLNTC